jgi:uncharacterized protein (TIGR03067 family)
MRYVLTGLAVGLLLAAAPDPKDDARKDQEALQGTWKVVSVEQGGKAQDRAKESSVVIEKDTLSVKGGDYVIVQGTFKLDPTKKPRTIDLTVTKGHREEDKGKQAHGIYELDKGTLKWCTAEPGDEARPKEFASKEGTKHMCITLRKEKP